MGHSPGPWTWGVGIGTILHDATGKRLLEVPPGAIWNVSTGDPALIAAAPRMLELLRRYVDGPPYSADMNSNEQGRFEVKWGEKWRSDIDALLDELKKAGV